MKKINIILMFLLCNILYSQEKGKVDYSIGMGLHSLNGFLYTPRSEYYSSLKETDQSVHGDVNKTLPYTPIINVAFKYAILKNWFLNAEGVYELSINKIYFKDQLINKEITSYYTLGLGTDYHYINSEFVQLYSGGSIGYTLRTLEIKENTKRNFHSNFHLNIIGVRIGKKIAGTFELGLGYKGFLNVGLSYQP